MPNDSATLTGRAGTEHDRERHPWKRPGRFVLIALVLGMLASLYWFVHPWYDAANDAAMYILTGRSVADGEGYSMLGSAFRIRPPGFTMMIAPIIAWRGTDFYALNLLLSLWGVLGCALLYCFTRERLGTLVALLVALVVWLNPGYQNLCNQTMSDVPGTTFLLGCLLVERWAAKKPSWKRDVVLGLFIGSAAYMRTVLLLLVPSIVGMRFVRRLGRRGTDTASGEPWRAWLGRAVLLAVAAVAVQVPWSVRTANLDTSYPVDQTLLYSYGTGMFHEDMGDPQSSLLSLGEIFDRFPKRGGQAISALGRRLIRREESVPAFSYFLIACLAVVWIKRRETNELFTLGTLAIVTVYFGFASRLMLPIFVMALPAAAEVVRDVGQFVTGRLLPTRARAHAGTGVAVLALAGLLVVDGDVRHGWDRIERKYEETKEIVRRFELGCEPDAVLAAGRAWHYSVFAERDIYALEFVWKRTHREDALEALIDKYGINTVALSPRKVKDRELLPYFERRYGPSGQSVTRVFRVRD